MYEFKCLNYVSYCNSCVFQYTTHDNVNCCLLFPGSNVGPYMYRVGQKSLTMEDFLSMLIKDPLMIQKSKQLDCLTVLYCCHSCNPLGVGILNGSNKTEPQRTTLSLFLVSWVWWVGRLGPMEWAPRFLDLSPMDFFFFWVYARMLSSPFIPKR